MLRKKQYAENQCSFNRILESLDLIECIFRGDFLMRMKKIVKNPLILSKKDNPLDGLSTKENFLSSLIANWINLGNFESKIALYGGLD